MAKLKTGRHTSSLKAARKAERTRWANRAVKQDARDLAKQLEAAVRAKDADKVKALLPKVMSSWKRMGNRNVVHPVTASRKIARLSASAHKAVSAK